MCASIIGFVAMPQLLDVSEKKIKITRASPGIPYKLQDENTIGWFPGILLYRKGMLTGEIKNITFIIGLSCQMLVSVNS